MLAHEISENVKTLFAELQRVVYNYLISGAASEQSLPFHFLHALPNPKTPNAKNQWHFIHWQFVRGIINVIII